MEAELRAWLEDQAALHLTGARMHDAIEPDGCMGARHRDSAAAYCDVLAWLDAYPAPAETDGFWAMVRSGGPRGAGSE